MKKSGYLGFTIIEMLIVITIISLVSAGAVLPVLQGIITYNKATNLIEANWQAQYALERIVRELRSMNGPGALTSTNTSSITFNDLNGNLITYSLNSSQQLTRTNANGLKAAEVLANGISGLAFTYQTTTFSTATNLTTAYIIVSITVNYNGANFVATNSVYLRNYS